VKVRFQADADLNQTILLALVRKEPAIDFRLGRHDLILNI
jgi:hypothetical protein